MNEAIHIDVLGDDILPILIIDDNTAEIEVVADDNVDIDINEGGVSFPISGIGTIDMNDLTLSGDLTFYPGPTQKINFTGGMQLTQFTMGIPSDNDLHIGALAEGNGNIHLGKSLAGIISVANNMSVAGTTLLTGAVTIGDDIGTALFVSGFAGSGWKIDKDTDYTLTVDNLYVRKQMNVYELIINQIRSTNGSLWVSDAAKIKSVIGMDCYIDTDNGSMYQPFAVDDIVRCQKFNGRDIKYYTARVTAIDPAGEYFTITILEGAGTPAAGDELVRMGNATDTDRQGALYLTASDDEAPYMDIIDNVTSASLTGKTVVRLGKLDGITDVDFGGELSGYGLYAQNVYLKGQIIIGAGSSGFENFTDKPTNLALSEEVAQMVEDMQEQIDGKITTYYESYAPTLSNAPYSAWVDNTERDQHIGDLFFNRVTGYGYRFAKPSGIYTWELVKDSDITTALANAAAAQDTADGKRRIFITTPEPPYDIGDLWTGGPSGDLRHCTTARSTGDYTASDWALATKYTQGATWGTNLYNIPSTLATPSGAGLFLSATHMGYYADSQWKTYIDSSGNFLLGDVMTSHGLTWNQSTGTLTIRGAIEVLDGYGYDSLMDRPVPFETSTVSEYYSFDENSGNILEDHVNGRNGTYNTRISVAGVINNAASIPTSGGGYANISSLYVTRSFSVSFWVRSTTSTWPNSGSVLFTWQPDGIGVYTDSGTRKISFGARNTSGTYTEIANHTPSDIQVWHHYALSYNGDTGAYVLYVDGQQVSSGTTTITRSASATIEAVIGGAPTIGIGGYLDELYIFNTAITLQNVKYLYELRDPNSLKRTKTVIDGGLITTGSIQLGNGTTIKAGISGTGTAETDIRLWAGATYASRTTAPFRVEQSGKMYATSGAIGGWILATDAIYSYEGTKSTANGFSSSGITMASDGSIHAPNFYLNADGTIGFRTSTSGQRILINSTDNTIQLIEADGSNILMDGSIAWWGTPGLQIEVYTGTGYRQVTYNIDGLDWWSSKIHYFSVSYSTSDGFWIKQYNGSGKMYFDTALSRESPSTNENLKFLYWDQVTHEVKAHTT